MPAKTPLFAEHERLGATITDFHGWLLPVYYSMPIAEHNAVRERCGLFDVSHMGALLVEGKDAQRLIQRIVVRDISKMCAGEIKLGAICNEKGGIVDDLTIYKFAEEKFWLVVNAGPYDTDLRIAKENAAGLSVSVEGLRAKNAKIDIQGPKAALALQKIAAEPLGDLKYYNFKEMKVGGAPCVVSRSGYTGEDGFEIYFGAKHAQKLWRALLEAGKEFGIAPCGLGARDTLRLEAGMLLSGQDIGEEHSILECAYKKIIGWEKEFIGKDTLLRQKAVEVKEKLVGFELLERGIARHECAILKEGKKIGAVTSGSFSPTLKKSIGLGYIQAEFSAVGAEIQIGIRGNLAKAVVVKMPFYKRGV